MGRHRFNEEDFTFSTPLYPQALRVLAFTGHEEMSRPFAFEIELVTELPEIDLEALVGEAATLQIDGHQGIRRVHGMIEAFELRGVGRKMTRYNARLVPNLNRLAYQRRSRIFQQMSVPEIVRAVLDGAGIGDDGLHDELSGDYGKRDYCVQYQETDLAFVARLLEEEGIFFFFEHDSGREVLVLADGNDMIEPLPGTPLIRFRDESRSIDLEEEHLFRFEGGYSMGSGRFTSRDYRFKHPALEMEASRPAGRFDQLEVYQYPGEYVDPAVGQQLARVRAEELALRQRCFRAQGTCRSLIPGRRFTLELHPRDDMNREYLIQTVEHSATQPMVLLEEQGAGQVKESGYQCRVTCVPAHVAFRPACTTPRPVVSGMQTAVVVGPHGEEIHCDEFGRVKVQFHWDREGKQNDSSSCWIRVSQPWGGTAYGGIFLPRVGQEVLVHFLEGDPDRPVIVGRVYNGDNPVPYGLPEHRTRSALRTSSSPGGGGFNELRFEDRQGREEIFLHAQKDFNTVVLHDESVQVSGCSRTMVTKELTLDSTSESVHITAAKAIVLRVGESRVTLTPEGVVIEAPAIRSEAGGEHDIRGGVIKLNCG